MRSHDEVKRAHDILQTAMHLEDMGLNAGQATPIAAVVLCWLMEHESGDTFADIIERIANVIRTLGVDPVTGEALSKEKSDPTQDVESPIFNHSHIIA